MKTAKEYRIAGRADLAGKWKATVLLTLVVFAIILLFNCLFMSDNPSSNYLPKLIYWFVFSPLLWAYTVIFLRNHRNEADPFNLSHLLDGYKDYLRITFTLILVYVYTFLWTLLLIVPGIIKSLSYSMTRYILNDNPDMKYNDAIELSMRMMNGHKMELFLLLLPFIGLILLAAVFTLGIGLLWVIPYADSTMAIYYEDLKAETAENVLSAKE